MLSLCITFFCDLLIDQWKQGEKGFAMVEVHEGPLSLLKSHGEPGRKGNKAESNEMFWKTSQDIRLNVYTSVPKMIHLCFHWSYPSVWRRKNNNTSFFIMLYLGFTQNCLDVSSVVVSVKVTCKMYKHILYRRYHQMPCIREFWILTANLQLVSCIFPVYRLPRTEHRAGKDLA